MINLLNDSIMTNPYPTYNELRESASIHEIHPGNSWFIGRYADVCSGLNNYELFTATRKTELFSPAWLRDECQSDLYLTPFEPPEYRRKRAAISPPFCQSSVSCLMPLMEDTAKTLVANVRILQQYDFIAAFAYPYVGRIVNSITGLDGLQTSEETRIWIQAVEQATLPNLSQCEKDKIQRLIVHQKTLFKEAIEVRRKVNKGDFVSQLVASFPNDNAQSNNELINAFELLIRSGFQTTVHILATAIIQLKQHPTIVDQLLSSPELIPSFVEELLRLYTSLPFVVRHTTQEKSIHGVTVPEGATIYFCLAAANRDPRQFANPDSIDLNRGAKKDPIAFGFGPHICLGMHLARLELQVAIKHLVPQIKHMSCPEEGELKWIKTLLFRGLEALPIVQHPSR